MNSQEMSDAGELYTQFTLVKLLFFAISIRNS